MCHRHRGRTLFIVVNHADTKFTIDFVRSNRVTGDTFVPANKRSTRPLIDCQGEMMRIRTESGRIPAEIDEPVCPQADLTIAEDGQLSYDR
jgi:hypothetical protein